MSSNPMQQFSVHKIGPEIKIAGIDLSFTNASLFMGNAFKLGTELVAAVGVGTIIGFILDSWFDTKPWLIIIFFFLGAAAGLLNVIRTANQMQKED